MRFSGAAVCALAAADEALAYFGRAETQAWLLADHVRVGSYRAAMLPQPEDFAGATVHPRDKVSVHVFPDCELCVAVSALVL